NKRLPLTVNTDSPNTGTRKKVNVSLEAGADADSMRVSVLSASVINTAKINDTTATAPNILSSLLLSTDIKGYIENPGYYFAPEKHISIKGQARKLGRKAPASKASMTLVPTHNFMDFIDTVANEDGYFEFDQLFFPDSIKFLITAKDEKGRNNIDILITEETSPTIDPNRNEPGEQNNVNALFIDELLNRKKYFAG